MKHKIDAQLDAVLTELSALRTQVERLSARVEALEAAPAAAEKDEDWDEDELVAVSAAVAAYLGEGASIRQVRLLRGHNWTRQGRVEIHHSHRF